MRSGTQPGSSEFARQPFSRAVASNHGLGPGDVADSGVSEFDEVPGGQPGSLLLVDGGDLHSGRRFGAGRHHDHRDVGDERLRHVRHRGLRRDHHDAFDALVDEVPEHVIHRGRSRYCAGRRR